MFQMAQSRLVDRLTNKKKPSARWRE